MFCIQYCAVSFAAKRQLGIPVVVLLTPLGQCPYFFAAIQKSVAQDVVICRNLRMIEQSGEGAVLGTSLNSKPDRVGPAALCSCITPLTAPATLTYTTVVGVQGVGLSFSGCCGAWAAGSATSGWQGSVFIWSLGRMKTPSFTAKSFLCLSRAAWLGSS